MCNPFFAHCFHWIIPFATITGISHPWLLKKKILGLWFTFPIDDFWCVNQEARPTSSGSTETSSSSDRPQGWMIGPISFFFSPILNPHTARIHLLVWFIVRGKAFNQVSFEVADLSSVLWHFIWGEFVPKHFKTFEGNSLSIFQFIV